jgi:hypothetical protein
MEDGDDPTRPLLTDREAFIAMRLFLEQYYVRAGNDMETLIADVTLESDGLPLDPAAWDDWTTCLDEARGRGATAG